VLVKSPREELYDLLLSFHGLAADPEPVDVARLLLAAVRQFVLLAAMIRRRMEHRKHTVPNDPAASIEKIGTVDGGWVVLRNLSKKKVQLKGDEVHSRHARQPMVTKVFFNHQRQWKERSTITLKPIKLILGTIFDFFFCKAL
jgi:hypothetical protein